jgi:hypothetical protein
VAVAAGAGIMAQELDKEMDRPVDRAVVVETINQTTLVLTTVPEVPVMLEAILL